MRLRVCGTVGNIFPTVGNDFPPWKTVESTRHHIMRGGLRPPTQQGGRRLRRQPPCWVSHYVVTCGFQRGAALASAVPHWFPHVRLNISGFAPTTHQPQPGLPSTPTEFGSMPIVTSTVARFSIFLILLWGLRPKPLCGKDAERNSVPCR